ncbi:hypothetical protein FRAAL5466 [Frankia alni ACN14a]|uniref:Uncharacterized protein n=1 Tax=Frankia alni (strain DSM 45986 / CECT 9034 / ACN14a) TaxID=326424 RepID=Q0REK9_FRAAA|nr:hypothetical protein FRAAL5466 [Frankia alni ACN14a]
MMIATRTGADADGFVPGKRLGSADAAAPPAAEPLDPQAAVVRTSAESTVPASARGTRPARRNGMIDIVGPLPGSRVLRRAVGLCRTSQR